MATKAIIAYGATVERSLNGTSGWSKVPEATGIAIPQVEKNYIDATSLDSPNGFMEYIPGLKDAGTISVPMNYTAAGYEQALADEALGVPVFYRTTMARQQGQSTGDMFRFAAYPTPRLTETATPDKVDMSLELRITGDVTWTKGTAAA